MICLNFRLIDGNRCHNKRSLSMIWLMCFLLLLIGCVEGNQHNAFNYNNAAQIRITLGYAYLSQNELKLAYRNIHRAITYTPNNYQAQLAMAAYQRQVGEVAKATQYYERAQQLAPQQIEVLTHYADFLCEQKNYQKANVLFELALKKTFYDSMAEGLASAGYCYLQQGQTEQAIVLINRALKHDPQQSQQLINVIKTYIANGQDEQANLLLAIYQQYVNATAESVWLQLPVK